MKSRWCSALIKTVVLLVIVHVIFLILGAFWGTRIGFFGLSMIWPHWHTATEIIISIILFVVIYFLIYAFWTDSDETD